MADADRLNKNLTARIMDDLGRAIVTGRYQVGTILPFEEELHEQFSASRTVLREAIKMLTAKGLLEARQRRGTIVQPEHRWNLLDPDVLGWMLGREFSIDLLIDFTELRLAIEPRAASLAARTASEGQRQAMVAAIARMYSAETGTDDPLESDIAFHAAVLQASNNRFMRQFSDVADATLRYSIRRTNEYKGVSRASAAEHQGVVDLIIRGEAERAQAAMFDLIQGALDLLLSAGARHR